MSNKVPFQRKYAVLAAALLATGSLAFAPIAVPAFAAKPVGEAKSLSRSWLGTFTPSGVDSRLAEKFAANARNINGRFPFTPAGVDAARSRTMTVAARTDSPLTAGAVSVRNAIGAIQPGANKAVRLTATDYRLTASRGWQGFALPTKPKIASPSPLSELGNRLIERQRHTQFAADRLGKSEWFTASNAILDHAAQLNAGTGGPWANYALWRSRALTR